MNTRYNQRGMTAIGWLLVLGLIGCFTLITLRLVPLYLEYYKVVAVLEGLEGDSSIAQKDRSDIMKIVRKRFDVNDVRHVDPDLVKIIADRGVRTISIDYERRTHMVGNVDVVARFSKSVEVPGR